MRRDAVAAVDDELPLPADEVTWAGFVAYRRVLTYVLNVATEPGFVIDEAYFGPCSSASRSGWNHTQDYYDVLAATGR